MCYEGEAPDFSTEVIRKARKAHKCYECLQEIPKGTQYHLFTGKWNGEVESFKVCFDCERMRGEIYKEELAEGCDWQEATVPFGMLQEAIKERTLRN